MNYNPFPAINGDEKRKLFANELSKKKRHERFSEIRKKFMVKYEFINFTPKLHH